jgi:glycolate oxidase iron-sulfur subunit
MDSPRGRIYLMKAALEDRALLSERFVSHFDACLGCLACTTACPSGVDYGPLIESMRVHIERRFERPWPDRLFRRALFAVLPYPGRLRLALLGVLPWAYLRRLLEVSGVVALLPPRVRALARLAPPVGLRSLLAQLPERSPAEGTKRARVGLLTGCVQRLLFSGVNAATARVLAAEGYEVVAPARQGCCGALSLHAGDTEQARAFARSVIELFERAGVDSVVVNVAGCGSVMKDYGHLLAGDREWADRAAAFARRVRDVSEFLVEAGAPRRARHPLSMTLAYHDACHLVHGQRVREQPRELLRSIPGLTVLTIPESEICCGSAGIYNLVQPVPAGELGARKVAQIASTRPDAVATGNAGCLLQIRTAAEAAGRSWPAFHPIEVLDASIRGVSVKALLGSDPLTTRSRSRPLRD